MADDDVRAALMAAYQDGSWGKYFGNYVERLESELQGYFGMEFVQLCGSGTFAVELALRASKIGPGDEVIVAAYDYPGNFHCIHAVGASPVLLDIDPGNWNLAANLLPETIGPSTRAIIISHLHGGLVPMQETVRLAKARGLIVIEDAAQSPGAIVEGKKAGSWGDAGIISFGGSKLLTAGRGGALLTRQPDVHQRARLHVQRAGNHICPLSELQAAVLLPQLAKLDANNQHRLANVQRLKANLLPGLTPLVNKVADSLPAYYKFGIKYDAETIGLSRDVFVAALRAEGVAIDAGFHAQHIGRSSRRFRAADSLPVATDAHSRMLVLHHPVLLGTTSDVDQVSEAMRKVHAHADGIREFASQQPTNL